MVAHVLGEHLVVADRLPLDRELKGGYWRREQDLSGVADRLPLDRELKDGPLVAVIVGGHVVADRLPLDRELKANSNVPWTAGYARCRPTPAR